MASDILNGLVSQFGGTVLEQLGAKVGLPAGTVKKLAPTLISVVMGGLVRKSKQADGAQAIQGLLDTVGSNKALASGDVGGFLTDFDAAKSADMLKVLAGGNSVKNLVGNIADQAGIPVKAAGGLLSAVAPMAISGIGKVSQDKGLDVAGLTSLLGDEVKGLSGLGDIDKMLDYTPGIGDQIKRGLKGLLGM